MDRLTRVTIGLAIVFVACYVGSLVGEDGSEGLAFLGCIGTGVALSLLATTRIFVLTEGWSTRKAFGALLMLFFVLVGVYSSWMTSSGALELLVRCAVTIVVLPLAIVGVLQIGAFRKKWSIKIALPLLITVGAWTAVLFVPYHRIIESFKYPIISNP